MGERANGDKIYATLGIVAQGVARDAAAGLCLELAADEFHGCAGVFHGEIVEHDAVGSAKWKYTCWVTRLFMIVGMPQELEWDEVMSRLATLPKQAEWEALTAQYQQAEATATSDAKWKMMERIFHLYEHEADYSEYISEDICH